MLIVITKPRLLVLALLASNAASAYAYSDAALSPTATSPFDRSYEASRQNRGIQAVEFRKSENSAAVLDLSIDDPIASLEETETEKKYRQVIQDLEESRAAIVAAKQAAASQLDLASETALQAAIARKQSLDQQQEEILQALELNQKAQEAVELQKAEQIANIRSIKAESDQLLMLAETNAEIVETAARAKVQLERIDPTVVMNEAVKAEFYGATLEEIVTAIMPSGWRVRTDFTKKPEIGNRRYEFISTDPRDMALRSLTSSVRDARVEFRYFWDLTATDGTASPMILLTVR